MLRRDLVRAWLYALAVSNWHLAVDRQGWHWVKAAYTIDGWSISEGDADVSIENGKFNAKLFRKGSDEDVQVLLKGAIQNEKLTVKETIQGSDYTGSTYKGTFRRKKWQEFSGTIGAESINLSDGWGMIGIMRSIPK